MDATAISNRLALAHRLADAAGAAILPWFRQRLDISNKAASGFDPVTRADEAAEQAMRAILADAVPDDAVTGEEYEATSGTSGWTWVLDPIDGTRAFIAGTTTWGVLIAACWQGEPVIGIIDQPFVGERWAGSPAGTVHQRTLAGAGTDQPVTTAPVTTPAEAILATTDPYLFSGAEADAFARCRAAARLTRYGLDCMAYAYLASGGVSAVMETGLKPVDVAALVPVVRGAGGVITSWDGAPVLPLDPAWDGSALACATPQLHEALRTRIDATS